MTEDIKGLIVYFVTEGPTASYCSDGTEVWQCKAQVSNDSGKTVGSMVFTFETEDHAIDFKRDVNSKIEPIIIGEEE